MKHSTDTDLPDLLWQPVAWVIIALCWIADRWWGKVLLFVPFAVICIIFNPIGVLKKLMHPFDSESSGRPQS